MVIKDNRQTKFEHFEDLKEGEVFYDKESENYYMKIAEYDEVFNAINLESTLLVQFCKFEEVIKVNATLTIE